MMPGNHPLDLDLSALKHITWTASLPFKGHYCHQTDIFNASSETEVDLFAHTKSEHKGLCIRFSPSLYPITGGFVGKDSGGRILISDILQAARSVGNCALVSNGSGGPPTVRILKCSKFRNYSPSSFEQGGMPSTMNQDTGTGTDPYRVTTYTGDKKNARGCNGSGKSMKRRSTTLRNNPCTCRAKFTLRFDANSFFMVCGIGENQHSGHPCLVANEISNRKRFIDPSTLENVAAMAVANIQPAQAAVFTKARTGQIFTRGQMAYAQGFSRMARELMASPNVDAMATQSECSPSDNMLRYLQESGAAYVCLYHNGKTKEVRGNKVARIESNPYELHDELTSVLVVPTDDTSPSHQKSVPLEVVETAAFKKYASESRLAVGAREDQDILVG
jgi:hypothetical protein